MDEWELDSHKQREAVSPSGPQAAPSSTTPPESPGASASRRSPLADSEQLTTGVQPGSSPTVPASPESGSPRPAKGRPQGKRAWPLQVAAALLILLVGVMIGFFVARGQTAGDEALLAQTRDQLGQLQKALAQSEDRNWAYYRANQALRTELEEARTTDTTGTTTDSSAARPDAGFGDGVFLVGEDIPPDTYDGIVDGETGYWARLKATDGSTSAIIANAIVRGPFVLTIHPGDMAVELRGVTIVPR